MKTIDLQPKRDCQHLLMQPAKLENASRVYQIEADTVFVDEQGAPVIIVGLAAETGNLRELLLAVKYGENNRSGGLSTKSRTFGALPRNTIRRDYCTQGGLLSSNSEADHAVKRFAATMGERFAVAHPSAHAESLATVAGLVKPEWRLPGGAYTSGIVNLNSRLSFHRDSLNFASLWSGMLTFKRDLKGGALAIPEYDMAIDLPDASIIWFQGQKVIHGVLPFFPQRPSAHRLTIVYYAMEPLKTCGTMKEELLRVRSLKTERTQKRAASISTLRTLDVKQMPQCPIFIPTRGGARVAASAKTLKGARMPFTFVVAPDDAGSYRALWPDAALLVLPQGASPNQFILQHARANKIARYWRIDDYAGEWYARLNGQLQLVPPNYVLREVEKETDAAPRLAIASLDYLDSASLTDADTTEEANDSYASLIRTGAPLNDQCDALATGAKWQTRLYHKFATSRKRGRKAGTEKAPTPGKAPLELYAAGGLTFTIRPGTSDKKAIDEVITRRGYRKTKPFAFDVAPGETWLDLGANIGSFSAYALARGAAHVIAVEPDPVHVELLRLNAKPHALSKLTILEVAVVADDRKSATLHLNTRAGNTWRNSIERAWKGGEDREITCLNIGNLISKIDGEFCIKMDIEGTEIPILEWLLAHGDVMQRVRKLVFEWSFDVNPDLKRFRSVMTALMAAFPYVQPRKLYETEDVWPASWFPPAITIFCKR